MKIKLARLVIIFLLAGVGSFAGATKAHAAPRLNLEPASITVLNNATFELRVAIDVESNQAIGSDAVISYDDDDFDVTGVSNGGFFPNFAWANDPENDRLEIHAGSFQIFSSNTGAGTLAIITLRAKKSSGSATVSFRCGPVSPTSQILSTTGTNILSCGSLNQSTITFDSQTQPTNTPVPTATPLPTATSAPDSGNNINPVCEGLSVNKTSGTTPLTVTFSCTGSDTDDDVNYAEFTFGDGQQLSIEKNIGAKGTISTTHTYTITGSFAASCRVRDNNGSFSSRPGTCQKTIAVSRAGTTTFRPTATPIPPTPQPTIGTQLVALTTITPTPTIPLTSPTPMEEQKEEKAFPWASIGVGAIILTGLLLTWWYMHKKSPPLPY
ncbi:hypothetical protein A2875_00390 [Candidatus Gottesmanbacteria bacterium RIFCSPHIGHO2_01_FULL_46_14]|uniref:PKD domain-containing protein n=2 Tax=Candidatus Gottesmaniibacteriota TaxID=1752720 RepID=A0A1F5ZMA3_9BACT|nr:MAG: hypothetical protein A2875_00390 [Candidatus Gottesmanbacteria bacterium RIFCSPHIGHO2_01_FULL_46_14]OGG28633.1 MAG: hypothetical protein A2971_02405 [Candidatus Gottesmanbacteria bacterium RIFCSPLOWO2_01_FULL_46_21]